MTDRELDAMVHFDVMAAKRPKAKGVYAVVPHYSTDIAAAWEVVEKLKSRKLEIEIGNNLDRGWYCLINAPQDAIPDWHVEDDLSAPRAICLAALKAVGCDVNSI